MSLKEQLKKYRYKVVTIIVNGETEEIVITSVHSDYVKAVGLDKNKNLIVKTFPLNNIPIIMENPQKYSNNNEKSLRNNNGKSLKIRKSLKTNNGKSLKTNNGKSLKKKLLTTNSL